MLLDMNDIPDAKSLGARLREARKRAGFTQSDVAERLRVTTQAVSQWERGTNLPSIENLKKLADFTANPSTYSIIYVTATLSGCVVYDSVLGDRNHVTEFILGLAQRDSSGGRMWLPFPVEDGEISADRLVLEPGMGSGNAD